MKAINFITGNENKVREAEDHLGFLVKQKDLDIEEIQSLDIEAVVRHKAKEAYQKIKLPVLVEDVSLEFLALNKLPGTLIKWFLKAIKNEGLCKLIGKNREAVVKVCYGFYDGKKMNLFLGQTKGSISLKPRGETNFGFDPIFIPSGSKKTWAEVSLKQKQKKSARRIALDKLKVYLSKYEL